MDELANGLIDGHQSFGVQFAERYVKGPLSRSSLAQAIKREIGALAQADAGVTDEQEGIAGYIVTMQQFLLNEVVLFGGQRARQPIIVFGKVVGKEQARQGGKLVEPSQFFQQAAERDDVQRAGWTGDGRLLQDQPAQPSQDVWIPAQLLKGDDRRMMLTQVTKKILGSRPIVAFGRIAHRRRHRLSRSAE